MMKQKYGVGRLIASDILIASATALLLLTPAAVGEESSANHYPYAKLIREAEQRLRREVAPNPLFPLLIPGG